MSSDSEDEVIFGGAAVRILLAMGYNRQYSVHPVNMMRRQMGQYYTLFSELKQHPERFFEYLRMDIATFNYILKKVAPHVKPNWTNFVRQPISTEEKLVVMLRYLATGESFKSLSFQFRMGATTVGKIVKEILSILWSTLQPDHLAAPTTKDFRKISDDFMRVWNFPNVIGAIDGKHIRINCPKNSGSQYINYKHFFSIVLQAVCDANYRLTIIEVGGYGRQSDGGTFQSSTMYRLMVKNKLQIPEEQNLPKTNTRAPFVFIADEAYALSNNLLKPYSRGNVTPEGLCFNQRLSRARKTIECTFGIMYSKWRILSKAIETDEKTADLIVKVICVLHNTVIDREGFERHLTLVTEIPENLQFRKFRQNPRGRVPQTAIFIRDTFKDYVNAFPIEFR